MPKDSSQSPSRRTVLKTGTAAGALAAFGAPAILPSAVLGQSAFNWKRFAGQKIDILYVKNSRSELLQKTEKEFEELTGIKVSSEAVPEQQQRQKVAIEFSSGKPTFDVVALSLHVNKRQAAKGKWLADLRPFLADKSLTSPDYDFDDVGAAGRNFGTDFDGTIITLPKFVDYFILYYNKELFEKKGVAYPQTFADIATAAAKLNDPANGVAGIVNRGVKNANVVVWTTLMLGHDQETVSPKGELLTTSDGAVAAAALYKELNSKYAPPGVVGFNWNECQTTFAQGRAAMWIDGIGFAPPLIDPTKSKVAGKVGYGVMPKGPKAHHTAIFGDGMGIANASQKKEAAYLYCQWATSKESQLKMLLAGAGSPARNAPLQNKEALAQSKFGKEYFDCLLTSAKIGRPGLPVIVPVSEFRDVFGIALTNMIGGADPKAELAKATEQFKPVLEKSEKA
ncbi:MAG: ABC transporter substrate-binding protein [Hyphomicrobiaceae bacterium]